MIDRRAERADVSGSQMVMTGCAGVMEGRTTWLRVFTGLVRTRDGCRPNNGAGQSGPPGPRAGVRALGQRQTESPS